MKRRRRRNALAALALLTAAALVVLWLGLLLWPYGAVRFASDPATVTPGVIERGGTITLTRDGYCNDDVDVTVVRWADRLDEHGHVIASVSLPPVQFFPFPEGSVCLVPSVQRVVIPDYVTASPAVAGGPDAPTSYRLRFETTYQANPIRRVTVASFTDPFVILPERG